MIRASMGTSWVIFSMLSAWRDFSAACSTSTSPASHKRSMARVTSTTRTCDETKAVPIGSARPGCRKRTRRNALASTYFIGIGLDVFEGLFQCALRQLERRQLERGPVFGRQDQTALAGHALGPVFL